MAAKGRTVSMGTYSGSEPHGLQRNLSLRASSRIGEIRSLIFVGLARGGEYTPVGGSGRVMVVHGVGKLTVDKVLKFENAYVILRFKVIRFAREMKLMRFYEFTQFLYEMWAPELVPIGEQKKVHSFLFADFNVDSDKVKELEGAAPFVLNANAVRSTFSSVNTYFTQADPTKFGRENKPIVNCSFKVVCNNGDRQVANGMTRSAWRVTDSTDSMTYSVIGDSRLRFSLVVGKEYKGYGLSVYYNGNGPPTLQPTVWAHIEECSSEETFKDIQTIESDDTVKKTFVFSMVKFASMAMPCPAGDCRAIVDVGTGKVLLVCPQCGSSFRVSRQKVQIELILNAVEYVPLVLTDGTNATAEGPAVENMRIIKYDVVQKLFHCQVPEKLFSNATQLHKASAEVMQYAFETTYDRETLLILDVERGERPLEQYADEMNDDESGGDAGCSVVKEEKLSSKGGKGKKRKPRKKKSKRKSRSKRSRRSRSSSSSSSSSESSSRSDADYSSSGDSLPTRARHRDAKKKSELMAEDDNDEGESGGEEGKEERQKKLDEEKKKEEELRQKKAENQKEVEA